MRLGLMRADSDGTLQQYAAWMFYATLKPDLADGAVRVISSQHAAFFSPLLFLTRHFVYKYIDH